MIDTILSNTLTVKIVEWCAVDRFLILERREDINMVKRLKLEINPIWTLIGAFEGTKEEGRARLGMCRVVSHLCLE